MIHKLALVVALAIPTFAAAPAEAAAYTAAQRSAIRAMPIQQRPNRPGHFYGNTIRALTRVGVIR